MQKQKSVVTKIVVYVLIAFIVACSVETLIGLFGSIKITNRMAKEELMTASLQLVSQAENEYDGDWAYKDGKLYKGEEEVGDSYQGDLEKLGKETGIEYSIIFGKTRVVSTLKDYIGKDVSDKVANIVLGGSDYYATNVTIGGSDYYSYYSPLKNSDGTIVGMAFAGKDSKSVKSSITVMTFSESMFTIAIVVVILIIGFVSSKKLHRAMDSMNGSIQALANGELRLKKDERLNERNDEFGTIGRNISQIAEKFVGVIGKVSDLSGKVSDSGVKLSNTTSEAVTAEDQVSKAVNDIAQGAQEQAEAVQRAANEVSSIGNDIANLNDHIEQLKELAANVRANCEEAGKNMEQLLEHNKTVTGSVESIGNVVTETAESVKEIESSTSAIEAIAAQTNLLSLNASIEAARAGEAGRGFAVVANEIQELAAQSKQAAANINNIVAALSKSSGESIETIDELKKAFESQNEQIGNVRTGLAAISESSENVSQAAIESGELSSSIDSAKDTLGEETESLSAISEENAASAEETSASMEQLSETFKVIEKAAGELQELAGVLDGELSFFKR